MCLVTWCVHTTSLGTRRGKIRFLANAEGPVKVAWYGDVRCERKQRWTVPPHPAHSPGLALSDSHFFGARKDASRKKEFGSDYKDSNDCKGGTRRGLWLLFLA
jgi:hypothetical protein